MLLAITDGVGLTGSLASAPDDQRGAVLSKFFRIQINAFDSVACDNGHWHVVKTTGDGLIFSVDEECDGKCERHDLHHNFLMALKAASKHCGDAEFQLRSVAHYCDQKEIIFGKELKFGDFQPTKVNMVPEVFETDVFGLPVIKLARIAAIAKGPFHLLSHDFVVNIARAKHRDHLRYIKKQLVEWAGTHKDDYEIVPDPVSIPYMKGFGSEVINHTIDFETPDYLWEWKPNGA